MCKHILNAQVAIRAKCCKKWFDCAECHAEQESHELKKTTEMSRLADCAMHTTPGLRPLFFAPNTIQEFACKKCKKCFRKDTTDFDDNDEYCPNCDNHYVIEARVPKPRLDVQGEDARVDARMLRDDRLRKDGEELPSIFDVKEAPNKLG